MANVHLLHLLKEIEPSGVCNIRGSLKTEKLSRKAQDTILQSSKQSTEKQYFNHLKKGSTIELNGTKVTLDLLIFSCVFGLPHQYV